jgi:hypothetical protein
MWLLPALLIIVPACLPALPPADIFLCQQANTQARMVKYAQNQDFFFASYGQLFAKLASLGYQSSDLVPQNW